MTISKDNLGLPQSLENEWQLVWLCKLVMEVKPRVTHPVVKIAGDVWSVKISLGLLRTFGIQVNTDKSSRSSASSYRPDESQKGL